MKAQTLRFIPLGGVGTIGMNCGVLEAGGDILVVDAGIKIPQEDMPGVDQILPDFTYLLENRGRVRGIVLTHGHDDHIGALPWLLGELPVPVYGTALTLAFARNRISDSPRSVPFDGHQLLFGQEAQIGPFAVTAIPVSHSIPDSAALAIRTPAGTALFTGDYKLDQTPVDGRATDMTALARLGGEGVDLMLGDSTNAERPGHTGSESEVGRGLEELFRRAPGRVFIATFSSHIHRIQQIYSAAARTQRRVALVGRRLLAAVRTARELGYLETPYGAAAEVEELVRNDERRAVFLTTGSQGEPLSALSRILRGDHPGVEVREHDTVIFSSRSIPGNELAVGRMVNEFFRRGAEVFYRERDGVHVSGHGSAGELAIMLNLVRPRVFAPVHGEYRHLVAHARLAAAVGVPSGRVFVLEPGEALEVTGGKGRRGEKVKAGRLLVDGDTVGDGAGAVVRERRKLAREGLVVVVAVPRHPVFVVSVGVLPEAEAGELDAQAAGEVSQALEDLRRQGAPVDVLREEAQATARAVYRRALQKKPRVLAVVMED